VQRYHSAGFDNFDFRKYAMAVKFFSADRPVKLTNRRKLALFITDLFARQGKSFKSLSYIFCSDEYLLEINRQYLDHDDYTDIISFLLSDPGQAVEGEIYISEERVRENAAELKVSFNEELHRVIFTVPCIFLVLRTSRPQTNTK
jgi:ssRNA-specific RNase YbeY (16S rRNA maturation enzyme)